VLSGRWGPLEICAVGEAAVRKDLFGDARQLGDVGVTPVGADDEGCPQLSLLPVAVADD